MKPKPTHGGARKGAGRKPRTIPRKAITVRLEPQDADKLRERCQAEELSQANWIAKQIRQAHSFSKISTP
jgi:predicted HicB family RNase H-like nuclease